MVRTPRCDKSGLRKGTWTPEEDRKLIAYVTRFGHRNWRRVPKFAGLARCGKSCRLRWMNYLRPDVKRGNYTQEEDQTIVKLHTKFGNRWSMIASHLPGRSDNEIKNHWHAHLKKRFQHNSVPNEKAEASKPKHHTPVKITDPFPNSSRASFQSHTPDVSPSPQQASLNDIFCTNVEPAPFGTNSNLALADYVNFLDTNTVPINADFWTQLYVDDVSYFPGELLAPFVTEPDCSSPVYDAQLWGLLE